MLSLGLGTARRLLLAVVARDRRIDRHQMPIAPDSNGVRSAAAEERSQEQNGTESPHIDFHPPRLPFACYEPRIEFRRVARYIVRGSRSPARVARTA
jgi:hypothetical protein